MVLRSGCSMDVHSLTVLETLCGSLARSPHTTSVAANTPRPERRRRRGWSAPGGAGHPSVVNALLQHTCKKPEPQLVVKRRHKVAADGFLQGESEAAQQDGAEHVPGD